MMHLANFYLTFKEVDSSSPFYNKRSLHCRKETLAPFLGREIAPKFATFRFFLPLFVACPFQPSVQELLEGKN